MALLLLALLHAYIGVRLLVPFPSAWVWVGAAALVALLALMLEAAAPVLWRRRTRPALVWAGYIGMGFFSSLLVLTLLRDVVMLAASLVGTGWPTAEFTRASALAAPALAVLATVLGFINARRRPSVRRVQVPVQGLPAALHGFSIVQISDLHVGPTIRKGFVEGVVNAANALQADVAVVTGDVVDGKVHELGEHTAPLGRLAARHGAYLVTGNHEYYSGATQWIAEFRRLGLTVLLNEHVVLEHLDERVVLAGVPDYTAHHFDAAHHSDPARALHRAPADAALKLLLAHQPRTAPAAAEAGFDLQLSGHTHGGQFFPWNFFVPLQQPYTAGLHRHGDMWIYTSRGTGYWGPPKRLGAPSEITLLTLVPA
jgi:hypothetical protein